MKQLPKEDKGFIEGVLEGERRTQRSIYERLVAGGMSEQKASMMTGWNDETSKGSCLRLFNPYSLLITREDEVARDRFIRGFKESFQESLEKQGLPKLSLEDLDDIAEAEYRKFNEKKRKPRIEYVITASDLEEERENVRYELLRRLQESGMLTADQVTVVQSWSF